MALERCPRCGRSLNTAECFACGYVDTSAQNPFGGNLSAAEKKRAKEESVRKTTEGSNPFGSPGSAQRPQPPLAAKAVPAPINQPQKIPQRSRQASMIVQPTSSDNEKTQVITHERVQRPSATPPKNAVESFLRSTWVFALLPSLAFVFVFGLLSFVLLRGSDPLLNKIKGSDDGAREVTKILRSKKQRSPRESINLGHAYAQLGEAKKALQNYQRGFAKGESDDAATEYCLLALENAPSDATPARDALAQIKGSDIEDELVERLKSERYNIRHNALKTLILKGALDDDARRYREDVAIRDLEGPKNCSRYKSAGESLRTYGEANALAALKSLNKDAANCLATDLPDIKRSIESRTPSK